LPITTFNGLFERQQTFLENKMDADAVLSKLADYNIITFIQGSKILVSLYLIYFSFYRSVCYPYQCLSVSICLSNVWNVTQIKETSAYILIPYESLKPENLW